MKLHCIRLLLAVALGTLSLAPASAQAPVVDGPYVGQEAKGWVARQIDLSGSAPQVEWTPVAIGQAVAVPAVGAVPAFEVRLRGPASVAPETLALPPDVPLFVVADTHGEYEILVELLQRHAVIDKALRWSYGRGHLAFLGDVLDRGAHQTEILWLIYQLEAEAARAGGGVHLVLGNHEAMNLRGDTRYLNPKYLQSAKALGVGSYADLLASSTVLGQWLRSKPTVLKIDRLLLLHGGISPALVERGWSLDTINRTVRGVLDGTVSADDEQARFVMGREGPLWYRGYFPSRDRPPAATPADIEATLGSFDVGTILVGHTKVPTVIPLYGGKVIAVQVYPHHDEASGATVAEGVVLDGGVWYRAGIRGQRERLDATSEAAAPAANREPTP